MTELSTEGEQNLCVGEEAKAEPSYPLSVYYCGGLLFFNLIFLKLNILINC